MPIVSVIIPAYNYARFIGATIQSVLDQTYRDFEVIVVDDGSTDNTGEVVGSFKDIRVRYIRQKNCGVSGAVNAGIKMAGGKYIYALGADDMLLPRTLELSVNMLDANPTVALTYGQAYKMDEQERIFGLWRQRQKGTCILDGKTEILKAFLNGNHIPGSTVMYRREYLDENCFYDTSFKGGSEDFDAWVRAARGHSVAYIAEPLIKYRWHIASISRTQKLSEVERNNITIFEKIFADPQLGAYFSLKRRTIFLNLYFRLSGYAYSNREMNMCREYLLKARSFSREWFRKRLWFPLVYRYSLTLLPPAALNARHKITRLVKMAFYKSASLNKHKQA